MDRDLVLRQILVDMIGNLENRRCQEEIASEMEPAGVNSSGAYLQESRFAILDAFLNVHSDIVAESMFKCAAGTSQ